MSLEVWREQLGRLLDVARLGAQFPDARRWRALVELLGREGPRGRPLKVALAPDSGLPSARTLRHLHRLQFVAREFFEKHRHRPSKEARAFSMALAALELPPVIETRARLVHRDGDEARLLVTHERLEQSAVRFALAVKQRRGPLVVGRDQLVHVPEPLSAALAKACSAGAREAFLALDGLEGLALLEVTRGELGPLVSSAWEVSADARPEVRALRATCSGPGDAVLSVTLERLAADVAQDTVRDPWAVAGAPLPGMRLARERRLFCTPGLEGALRALVGKQVLVRSR